MPVIIKIPKDGIAILLNCLPTLIISTTRSSTVFVIVLSIGERIMPMKIDPPTHIEAQIRCNHMMRLSARTIPYVVIFHVYILHAARMGAVNLSIFLQYNLKLRYIQIISLAL